MTPIRRFVAQILMMDPIPVISKIFSLVVQEKRQRSIHNNVNFSTDQTLLPQQRSTMAVIKESQSFKGDTDQTFLTSTVDAAMRGNQYAKENFNDKPACSHCHIKGHTVDKCYKLHGYPVGHPKYRQQQSSGGHIHANHAHVSSVASVRAMANANSLNLDRCRHLIAFLSSQLQLGHNNTPAAHQSQPSNSRFNGTYHEQDDWMGGRIEICMFYIVPVLLQQSVMFLFLN